MIVQIYEIQTTREAEIMVELGVDHVGSVLLSADDCRDAELKNTVRRVQAAGRKSSLIPLLRQCDAISRAVDFYQPDIVHLCENLLGENLLGETLPCETLPGETLPGKSLPGNIEDGVDTDSILKRQRALKERFPEIEFMRSIPIGRKGQGDVVPSLAYGALFEPWSDWFLTDTLLSHEHIATDRDQPVEGYVGITGLTCDWEIAAKLVRQSKIPVILAGGIGPDNVARGIRHVSPAGVDSCTLTNAMDGSGSARRFQKDPEKVKRMIQNARKAIDIQR
jgi:phosphoribosylanthranilate isomerase